MGTEGCQMTESRPGGRGGQLAYGPVSVSVALTGLGTTTEPPLGGGAGVSGVRHTQIPRLQGPMCGNGQDVGKSLTPGTRSQNIQVFASVHLQGNTHRSMFSPRTSSSWKLQATQPDTPGRGVSQGSAGPRAQRLCPKPGPCGVRAPGRPGINPGSPPGGGGDEGKPGRR